MDITQTTTLRQATVSRRDLSAHRKAYLDTYAKRRAGINTDTETQLQATIPAQQVAQQVQQPYVPVQQPTVVAVPVTSTQTLQSEPQTFSYREAVAPQTRVTPAKSTQTRKTYLDSLVYSHNQRVSASPQAIDTPIQPQLTETTQHLIEADSSQQIAANLDALYNSRPLTDHITKNKTSASAAHVRTIVASALTCGMLAVGIFAFTSRDAQPVVAQPIGSPVIEVEAPVNNTPSGAPVVAANDTVVHANPSDPVRLIASSIGVNARVDGLGTTPGGLIAVPRAYTTVGWYNKGSTPGQAGPAVLVGHYTGGNGGVFDNLSKLQDGDLITVKNGKNQVFTYRVTKKAEYHKTEVPMADIFKKSDTSRLEIITCAGKWQSNGYDNRMVVTAELV